MVGLNLLVTGKPGIGKTTLVARIVERLRGSLRLAALPPLRCVTRQASALDSILSPLTEGVVSLRASVSRAAHAWGGMASISRRLRPWLYQN